MTITRKYHTIRTLVHTISPCIIFRHPTPAWVFGRFGINLRPYRQRIHLSEVEYFSGELKLKRARYRSSRGPFTLFSNRSKLDQQFLERMSVVLHEERPEEEYYR